MKIQKIVTPGGEIRFQIRIRLRDGRQLCRRFATEREAKAEQARILHEQNEGTYVHPNKKMSVRKLAELSAAAAATRRKDATVRHYEDALRPVLDRHGDLPVVDLTSQHLVALRDAMLEGRLRRVGVAGKPLSARSVNAMLGAVHGVLAFGIHQRILTHNVADARSVSRVKSDGPAEETADRRGGWQNEHLAKFRVVAGGDEWAHGWLLSAVGLRRGEVLGLKWSDIDMEASTVTIRRNRTTVNGKEVIGTPKSRDSKRTLKVGARVMEALQVAPRTSEWVVVGADGERPRPELYSDRFVYLIEDVGLPQIVLHGVRHAVASKMASQGVPLASVARWLGQSQESLAVTLGYVHAQDAQMEVISELLD